MATWSPEPLFNRRAYGLENLRSYAAKRLLQQYRPQSDSCIATSTCISTTSSVRSRSDVGTSMRSDLAVLLFTIVWILAACSTGMSPGIAPLRILSMKTAARRNMSKKLSLPDAGAGGPRVALRIPPEMMEEPSFPASLQEHRPLPHRQHQPAIDAQPAMLRLALPVAQPSTPLCQHRVRHLQVGNPPPHVDRNDIATLHQPDRPTGGCLRRHFAERDPDIT